MRAVIATLFLSVHLATAGENWPRFRGPMGAGEAPPSVVLPDDWSPESTRWTSQLAGTGHSSPVIWEGKIFVTSAIDRGRQRILQCFDLQEGSELWRVQVASAGHKRHRFNSFATSTPAVDAMNVYLLWGQPDQIQVVAYGHEGELRWNKNLGAYKSGHGFGVSPIAVGGKLIIANDQEAANSIVALDTKTGKVAWSAERHPKRATYSTPAIFPHDDGSTDVIVSDWQQGISALDLATGEQRWTRSVFDTDDKQRAIGSPIVWDDLIIATCGFAAGKRRLVAIKAGEKPALAFQLDDFVPHVPTPLAHNNRLYLWSESGIVSCYELPSGDPIYERERITAKGKFFSSPIAVGDKIINFSNDGGVFVLAAKDEFEIISQAQLPEPTQATPAAADGRLVIRTASRLLVY